MTTNKVRRAIAAALCLACLVLAVIGGINQPKKDKPEAQAILNELRVKSLLNAIGEGVVESYVNIAKKEAQEKAKAEKATMAQIREAVAKAEEDTRAKYENSAVGAPVTATPELLAAADKYNAVLSTYGSLEEAAKQAYIDEHYEEAVQAMEARHEEMLAAGQEIPENDEPQVDMSGFVASAEMLQAEADADAAYAAMCQELKTLYPVLDDAALESLQETMMNIVYQEGDTFDTQYDRYLELTGEKSSTSGYLIRHGDDLIFAGLALLVLAGLVAFYELLVAKLGIPRVIIGVFFILLCFMCLWYTLLSTQ